MFISESQWKGKRMVKIPNHIWANLWDQMMKKSTEKWKFDHLFAHQIFVKKFPEEFIINPWDLSYREKTLVAYAIYITMIFCKGDPETIDESVEG